MAITATTNPQSTKVKKLTKEDILAGTDKRESVYIKEYNAEIIIHPLSDGDLSKIFSIIGPVPLLPDGTPDTTNIELHKNFEALQLAASLGIVEPKLSVEEVKQMKFGVPEYIGMQVLELSGISAPEIAKKKDEQ